MKKRRCRDGVTCVVLCVACTLPSIYLVCVVFGTAAIPTSLNIFGKCFSYLYTRRKGNWQKHRTTFSPSILGKLPDILPYLNIGKVDKERGM